MKKEKSENTQETLLNLIPKEIIPEIAKFAELVPSINDYIGEKVLQQCGVVMEKIREKLDEKCKNQGTKTL